MKTFLVILAVVALVALSEAKPSGGRRGPKGRKGALLKLICEVHFTNGTSTTTNNDCFPPGPGSLIRCQRINLSTFNGSLPGPLQNPSVAGISLCLPITCTEDSDCTDIDTGSTCVDGFPKPDKAKIGEVMESCNVAPRGRRGRGRRGRGPPGQGQRGGPADEGNNNNEGDDSNSGIIPAEPLTAQITGRRCSVPPSYFVAAKACRIVDPNGNDITTKECKNRRNETVTPACNTTSACVVPYEKKNVTLHFCEKPVRPENPQGGNQGNAQQGPERFSSDSGKSETGNGPQGAPQSGAGGNTDGQGGAGRSQTGGNSGGGRRRGGSGSRRGRGGGRRGGGGRRNRPGGEDDQPQQPEQNPGTNNDQP